jgi:hypothetical protein
MSSLDFTGTNGTPLSTYNADLDDVSSSVFLVSGLQLYDGCAASVGTETGGGARLTTSSEVESELVVDPSSGHSEIFLFVRADGTDSGYSVKITSSGGNWNNAVIYKDGGYYDEGSIGPYSQASQHVFNWSAQDNAGDKDLALLVDSTPEYASTDSSTPITRTGNPGFGTVLDATFESVITSWTDNAGSAGASVAVNPVGETNTAPAVTLLIGSVSQSVTPAQELDSAPALTVSMSLSLAVSPALETDAAPVANPLPPAGSFMRTFLDDAGNLPANWFGYGKPELAGIVAGDKYIMVLVTTPESIPISGNGYGVLTLDSDPTVTNSAAFSIYTLADGAVGNEGTVDIYPNQSQPVTAATETDSAPAVTVAVGGGTVAVNPVTETDSAPSAATQIGAVTQTVNPALETDAAQTVYPGTGGHFQAVIPALENDAAPAAVVSLGNLSIAAGPALESDTAPAVLAYLSATAVSPALETDLAATVLAPTVSLIALDLLTIKIPAGIQTIEVRD